MNASRVVRLHTALLRAAHVRWRAAAPRYAEDGAKSQITSPATSARPFSTVTPPARPLLQHIRSIHVRAKEPTEAPEEPLSSEPVLEISESALKQIERVQTKEKNDRLALRIGVESGGCHGYMYTMEVSSEPEPEDFVFEIEGRKARVIVDPVSLGLLSGSTLDYSTELIGSQFKLKDNPHASDQGGCGCGVSWELKA